MYVYARNQETKCNLNDKMSEIKFDYDDYDYRISSKLLEIYFLILECKRGILKVFSWKWYYAT